MGTMTSPVAPRRPAMLSADESSEHALILALARGEDAGQAPAPTWTVSSPFRYDHAVAGYLRP